MLSLFFKNGDKMIKLDIFVNNSKENIVSMFLDENVKMTYMLPDFKSKKEAEELFEKIQRLSLQNDKFVKCIYYDDGINGRVAIGIINETDKTNEEIELGYAINPKFQNKGYCTLALNKAINILLDKGYKKIICGAFNTNFASIKVMEKVGMSKMDKIEIINYRGKDHECVFYEYKL